MEEIYLALIVAVLFFVCKTVLNKLHKEKTGQQDIRDSFLAGLLTGAVLFVKKTQFSGLNGKAQVFVNEPGF